MRLDYAGPLPEPVGFLLVPRFSMMAFFSAVEPLRIANRLAGRALYRWLLISEDGQPVTASNDMTLLVDCGLADAPSLPTLAVCAGFEPERDRSRRLGQWLHRQASEGCLLGANAGIGISLGDDCVVEAGLYVTAGSKIVLADQPPVADGGRPTVKGGDLSGRDGVLLRRNSVTGAIEALARAGVGVTLNEALHA